MEDDYGSNVHARVKKSVRFMECPLWRGFVVRDYLGIHPGQNFLSSISICQTDVKESILYLPPHCTGSYIWSSIVTS